MATRFLPAATRVSAPLAARIGWTTARRGGPRRGSLLAHGTPTRSRQALSKTSRRSVSIHHIDMHRVSHRDNTAGPTPTFVTSSEGSQFSLSKFRAGLDRPASPEKGRSGRVRRPCISLTVFDQPPCYGRGRSRPGWACEEMV